MYLIMLGSPYNNHMPRLSEEQSIELNRISEIQKNRKDITKFFNGRWLFISKIGDQKEVIEEIGINGKQYNRITPDNSPEKLYDIELYDCDLIGNKLYFVKCRQNSDDPLFICELKIISNNRIEGTEGDRSVSYTRHTRVTNEMSITNKISGYEVY